MRRLTVSREIFWNMRNDNTNVQCDNEYVYDENPDRIVNSNAAIQNANILREWVLLIIGVVGTLACLFGVVMFNRYVLGLLPLLVRGVLVIVMYWIIALVPIVLMIINKDKIEDLGFSKKKLWLQIIWGLAVAAVFFIVLTLVPILIGQGENFGNGNRYTEVWQFAHEFVYLVFGVAAVEELVFRGFVYLRIKNISGKDWVAVVGSSVLFGLFHIFGGNVLQIILTGCMGAVWCLMRLKIKNLSTTSLIIGHGVYDWLISLMSALLLL